jgi:hypothetical protein
MITNNQLQCFERIKDVRSSDSKDAFEVREMWTSGFITAMMIADGITYAEYERLRLLLENAREYKRNELKKG